MTDARDTPQIKPAYLIAGTDEAKIDAAVARLRARAEEEGGPGALELFSAPAGSTGGPDADALVAAIPAMSLMPNGATCSPTASSAGRRSRSGR